jgi:hypothetical protein
MDRESCKVCKSHTRAIKTFCEDFVKQFNKPSSDITIKCCPSYGLETSLGIKMTEGAATWRKLDELNKEELSNFKRRVKEILRPKKPKRDMMDNIQDIQEWIVLGVAKKLPRVQSNNCFAGGTVSNSKKRRAEAKDRRKKVRRTGIDCKKQLVGTHRKDNSNTIQNSGKDVPEEDLSNCTLENIDVSKCTWDDLDLSNLLEDIDFIDCLNSDTSPGVRVNTTRGGDGVESQTVVSNSSNDVEPGRSIPYAERLNKNACLMNDFPLHVEGAEEVPQATDMKVILGDLLLD